MKEELVKEWARRLKDKCEGYALKDIFNTDEAVLFSLAAHEVACHQRRQVQGRQAVKGPPDSSPVCKCYRRETDASGDRQISQLEVLQKLPHDTAAHNLRVEQ